MKKNIQILLFLLLLACNNIFAQVGINTSGNSPDNSSMLDVQSTDKGMLIPRMTTTQRTAIATPATGLLVFDSTTASFWFYNGSIWEDLSANVSDKIADADNNTQIQVEETADDDRIRFDLAGVEHMVLEQSGGKSRFIFPANNGNYLVGESISSMITGGHNFVYGKFAGGHLSSGSSNIFLGRFAGQYTETGNYNTYLGEKAGNQNVSGSYNVFIGESAGTNNLGDKSVFIGYMSGANELLGNRLYIHNSATATPLIYGEFDNNLLRINGTLNINNTFSFPTVDGTASQVLQTDGGGNVSWGSKTVNTDNQTIDVLNLNGNTLQISLANDGQPNQTVDLTNIDNQTIDVLNLNGSTLKISLSDDNQATQTLDLSTINNPIGTVQMYMGTTAPSGWLICDGSAFSIPTYPELYALLGNNTLPNFAGRSPIGVGNSGTNGSTQHNLKSTGGEEMHTLSTSEMPAHTHNVTITYRQGSEQGSNNNYSDLGDPSPTHSSNYTTASTGGGNAHNNMSPFYTINFIIKAK